MNHLLLTSVAAAGLMAAATIVLFWMRQAARDRALRLRRQGHHLIHALRGYSAWIDWQRDQPITERSLDELNSPEPLTLVRQIKDESFPALQQHMVLLLQAHSRMIEYLWQHNLLRMTQGTGYRPIHEDTQYQQLRGAQEDLIDEIVQVCRELIGETPQGWSPTGSDFSFSHSGLGLPSRNTHRRG